MFFYISVVSHPLAGDPARLIIIREMVRRYYYPDRIPDSVDSIPFDIEGYDLVRAESDDRDYIIGCMMETVVDSVPKEEKDLRDFWIDDILQIVSDDIDSGKMGNEVFKLVSEEGYAGMLWVGISRDQFTCDETGYLLGVYVEKDLRRRGIGTALVRAAERWCSSKGLMSMTLNVGSVNRAAVGLYESMGYKSQSVVMRRFLKG